MTIWLFNEQKNRNPILCNTTKRLHSRTSLQTDEKLDPSAYSLTLINTNDKILCLIVYTYKYLL